MMLSYRIPRYEGAGGFLLIPVLGALLLISAAVSARTMSAAELRPGLLAVVYGDPQMTRPVDGISISQLDDRIVEWPGHSDGGLRMQGYLTAPTTGRLTLQVETSQRVRLWLGGRKVLDVGSEGGAAGWDFRAGESQRIILEYAQEAPPSLLRVRWQLPGGAVEPIPASSLGHDRSDVAAVERAVTPVRETLLEVANPDPARLASLQVWRTPREVLVRAAIPSVPDFVCNSWCYEGGMEFIDCRDLGAGRLELRHRLNASPDVIVITEVTPEEGAVEFLARLVREDGRPGPFPEAPAVPNLCWQVKASPNFASRPEPYPAFFARCFIFTADGLTFLDQTGRRNIPVQPPEDRRNNPPWVQMYGPAWDEPRRSPADAWSDYSPDRFVVPVTGVVSRDQKYLAALATGSADSLCQAWHDCLHINSSWGPPGHRTWRLKIYAMENDPTKLLERVTRDFPEIGNQRQDNASR